MTSSRMSAAVPRTDHPNPRAIMVDVDGCLLLRGRVNHQLVEWIRARIANGWAVYVWSSRGKTWAEQAAELAGLTRDVECLPKPGIVVDDMAGRWASYVTTLLPDQLEPETYNPNPKGTAC